MKIGVNLKIDVTKIDKAKLFQGKNGAKYLDMTAFIDIDVQGQYGDNGMIVQSVSKEEKDAGQKGAILGNGTVFWRDDGAQTNQGGQQQSQQATAPASDEFDSIPF